jgi:hypothetical protein
MRLARRNLTPKGRRFLVSGSLCLSASLILSIFDKDLGLQHAALYDVFNFAAMRLARNCPQNQP